MSKRPASKKKPAAKKPAPAKAKPAAKKPAPAKVKPAAKKPAPAKAKPAPKQAAPVRAKAAPAKKGAGGKPAAAAPPPPPPKAPMTLKPAPVPRPQKPAPPPPPSHPVSLRDAERYREQLVGRKAAITASYYEYRDRSQSFGDDGTQDVADQASNSYNKEFFLSLSQEHRNRIKMIDEALRRIERGDYGICANCGDEIEPRRLNAVPWSTLCLRCQEAIDQQRPQDLL